MNRRGFLGGLAALAALAAGCGLVKRTPVEAVADIADQTWTPISAGTSWPDVIVAYCGRDGIWYFDEEVDEYEVARRLAAMSSRTGVPLHEFSTEFVYHLPK